GGREDIRSGRHQRPARGQEEPESAEPLAPGQGAPAGVGPPELDRAAGRQLRRQGVAAERQHVTGESVDAESGLPCPRLVEQSPIGGQALVRGERGLHDQVERGRHSGAASGRGCAREDKRGAYHVHRRPTTNETGPGYACPSTRTRRSASGSIRGAGASSASAAAKAAGASSSPGMRARTGGGSQAASRTTSA